MSTSSFRTVRVVISFDYKGVLFVLLVKRMQILQLQTRTYSVHVFERILLELIKNKTAVRVRVRVRVRV